MSRLMASLAAATLLYNNINYRQQRWRNSVNWDLRNVFNIHWTQATYSMSHCRVVKQTTTTKRRGFQTTTLQMIHDKHQSTRWWQESVTRWWQRGINVWMSLRTSSLRQLTTSNYHYNCIKYSHWIAGQITHLLQYLCTTTSWIMQIQMMWKHTSLMFV